MTLVAPAVAAFVRVVVAAPWLIVIVGSVALVGTALNVPVTVDAVAPVGVIMTVPSALTIESAVALADVGTAETVTLVAPAVAAFVRVVVAAPWLIVIVGSVALVGTALNVPVTADAEAPVGVILTVPSPLTIVSVWVVADVGTALTVTLVDAAIAFGVIVKVFPPLPIMIEVAEVGIPENVPVAVVAVALGERLRVVAPLTIVATVAVELGTALIVAVADDAVAVVARFVVVERVVLVTPMALLDVGAWVNVPVLYAPVALVLRLSVFVPFTMVIGGLV